VVWPPEVDLFAHDHNMWAVIGSYGGREDNRFFRRLPNDGNPPHWRQNLVKGRPGLARRGDPPHVAPFDAEELQQVLELAAHRAGRP
jgi:hypothetical protein